MDILDKFIESAKASIKDGYYEIEGAADVEKVSLRQRLDAQPFSLITEIKHASPAGEYSFGHIDVEKAAADFRDCGADAISVVVEPKIFRGKLGNVTTAKKAGLPVLFKDFVMSKGQIEAARKAGADAILLVVKVARRENLDLDYLIDAAHKNGLEVLLECYNEAEMKAALRTDADILGINNRDLQTLRVDLNRTKAILDAVEPDRPLISESGIRTRADAEFVKNAGAKGILVGTAIWAAPDLRAKVKELRV